jgi:cobalt transporter subunit CbtB
MATFAQASASSTTSGATTLAAGATRTQTLIAAAFAAMLGTVMIWGVGFSHISAFHNAAHDVRHSNGFPCH